MSPATQVGSRAVWAIVATSLLTSVRGQYDFPHDSCACHIHYEHWVQQQYQLSRLFTSSFAEELFTAGSYAQVYVSSQECRDPHKDKNILEWTLGPATSDCTPGHLTHYILCAQFRLLKRDIPGAREYFAYANYLFPMSLACMDPEIWPITQESFYERYRAINLAASEWSKAPGHAVPSTEELQELAWRPLESPPDT
eukprot:TRINITY_DN59120_c1_g1_i1.p1 TRINITY_DN59120_c1_g1~~TRINITY_DN59120_c1_g1_i1.p1  ORF type:complete len:197 (+),score=12.43 TRINITY_DN59120_c1_g1_i1:157-747(+)